jgi:membrane-associated phospholipid phosphatase
MERVVDDQAVEERAAPRGAAVAASVGVPAAAWLVRNRWRVDAAYVLLSAIVVAIGGVPSRPIMVFWIVGFLGLSSWRNPNPIAMVVWDWLPILVIAGGYDLVRSRAVDLVPRAVTEPQLRFDEIVFGGTVPTVVLQDAIVERGRVQWWDYPAWVMYLSHFVFTLAIALWCYVRHRDWFRRLALLILTVSICGFITYFLLPAVPPWLASRNGDLEPTTRIVHDVWAHLGIDGAAKVFGGDAKLANPVAALPSLHAAWPFMVLLFLWNKVGRWRWAILGYNALMILVLVYGAEHYVSDILLGWLYAIVVYVVITAVMARREARRAEPSAVDTARA